MKDRDQLRKLNQEKKAIERNITKIDHETGDVFVPGKGMMPLVGPTSGFAYKALKDAEARNREMMRNIREIMQKNWRCTQCRKIWIVKFNEITGLPLPNQQTVQFNFQNFMAMDPITKEPTEYTKIHGPLCADRSCNAPVEAVERREGVWVALTPFKPEGTF